MELIMKRIFLGIGTNLGNRQGNLEQAVTRINEYFGPFMNSSAIYETEPWGFQAKD
jgi:2-amino-4-hydroxy-6-hydroxymethyldihydropteridine diphosphokinase